MEAVQILKKWKDYIDSNIDRFLPETPRYGAKLYEAVKYSLKAGGKRLRPALCFSSYEIFKSDVSEILPLAVSIEMIHTYSLVHDDLPSMDNDTLRRGKPTTWYVFGEARAVLAGDALLNRAFEIGISWALQKDTPVRLRALSVIADASGMRGMVLGQECDLDAEGREDVDLQELLFIHRHKTGRLIEASVLSGAIAAGAEKEEVEALKNYGAHIGLAFQIVDDILDVVGKQEELGKNVGSDEAKGKATFVKLLGVNGARQRAEEEVERAIESVSIFGDSARALIHIARFVKERAL